MTFDIEKFVAAPTQGELMTLKKDELLLIAKHYKLEDIKRSMRKAAICNSLLRYFVEQEIFEESEVEFLEETEVGSKASEQLAIKRMEMEERQKDREIRGKTERDRELKKDRKVGNWKKDRKVGNLKKDRKIKS